jgi:hypothetical protein
MTFFIVVLLTVSILFVVFRPKQFVFVQDDGELLSFLG